ncbi:MAG: hypothetical protein RL095_3710 [Verrucomicrobiota bacterium]|jgi:hypothetical protein
MKRNTKIFIGILIGAWVLTLGVFHSRSIKSTFTLDNGNAWKQFEIKKNRVYPHTWIDTGHVRRIGIPFMICSSFDQAPYSLDFCFALSASDPVKGLVIDSLQIDYRDGSTQAITLPPGGAVADFYLDERGKERGEAVYRRFSLSFPDAIQKRQDFKVTLSGFLDSEFGRDLYRESINVSISDENYFYIGWMELALSGI